MSQILNNRYQPIKNLGHGGFGQTFLAEDIHMPSARRCVIKQLKPIVNDPQVYQLVQERFQREAAILEQLGKGNEQIPELYAYFSEGGQFYLVQEWVDGVDLSTWLQQQGLQNEQSVQQIMLNVLPVLDYVHSQGIVHRDIKPENIMLRSGDNLPVLIDFGAVRETMGTAVNSQGNTTSSIIIGTPGFMPSEQAAGRPVFSSDLYALGLTAIYLLSGKMPQELTTDPQTGEIIWQQEVQPISADFATVLDKTVMSHPRDRFPSAKAILSALQGETTTPPTVASPQVATPVSIPTVTSPPTLPPPTDISTPTEITATGSQKGLMVGLITLAVAVVSGSIIIGLGLSGNNSADVDVASISSDEDSTEEAEVVESLEEEEESPQVAPSPSEKVPAPESNNVSPSPQTPSSPPPPPASTPKPTNRVWRSQSNLTRIANLDQICFGTSQLNSVQTVFGYDKPPLTGTVTIPSPQTGGCGNGDTLRGNFALSGGAGYCNGDFTVTWKNNNNAYVQWDINNLGSDCPMGTRQWEINTYPG
ncbi:MAG: serine/threonine-protein kinase [Spirulinaceae cyanobacterium]